MLNIIHYCYVPNTASTNRLIAYINNIPSYIHVRVYFLTPDNSKSKLNINLKNIEVIYCWELFPRLATYSKLLLYYISLSYIKKKINREKDVIYAYNVPKFLKYFIKSSINCYSERTEYPLINNYTSRLIKTTPTEHLNICRALKGLIVISTQLKHYYIEKGIKGENIHIINMIVDPERFVKIKTSSMNKDYLAYCGNASNNKDGVDKLIKAFALVAKSYPNLKLFIIGKGPDHECEYSNITLVRDLGIEDKVIFTGLLESEEVVKLLSGAKILLLNRPDNIQAQYGFPTKLGEYLMTGNPVVVTSVGDIPRFLKHRISAMLADPHDDKDFANQIIWLMKHPNEARTIGENGRQVAFDFFNAKSETVSLLRITETMK